MKTVLFYRDYHGFTGGHLAVWRYFRHVRDAPGYEARIVFSPSTAWNEPNPWLSIRAEALGSRHECQPDMLLLAGLDWTILSLDERDNPPVPIVNRVASTRHGEREDVRYQYLRHPAIRVCCSSEVRDAIMGTGQVNGPVFVIPDGIDVSEAAASASDGLRQTDVFIGALKNPSMGHVLADQLRTDGHSVDLAAESLPRPEYLARVRRARLAIFLTLPFEGLFNPPLEAMALGTLVICTDVPGVRSYMQDGHNGFCVPYDAPSVHAAASAALMLSDNARNRIVEQAHATAGAYTVEQEAVRLRDVLDRAPELWRELRGGPATPR